MRTSLEAKSQLDRYLTFAELQRALLIIPDIWHHHILGRDLLANEPDFSGVVFALDVRVTNPRPLPRFADLPAYRLVPLQSQFPSCLALTNRETEGGDAPGSLESAALKAGSRRISAA